MNNETMEHNENEDNQLDEISEEELLKNFENFEKILCELKEGDNVPITERDLSILESIQSKIGKLTKNSKIEKNQFLAEKAKKNKLITLRSSEEANKVKNSAISRPVKISLYNENLKLSQFLDRQEEDQSINDSILTMLSIYCEFLLEKADHILRLRMATMNSNISYKTADYFLRHFSSVFLECTDCCVVQKRIDRKGVLEVYGDVQDKNVRFFKFFQRHYFHFENSS